MMFVQNFNSYADIYKNGYLTKNATRAAFAVFAVFSLC